MKLRCLLAASAALCAAAWPAAASTLSAGQQRVEVAFVLDSTGSMGDLIDGAKRKIWSIATTIVDTNPQADIAMAIVTYRDRGDDYVVKSFPLSEDVQGLFGKLSRIQADGGGDTPESVNEALDKTIDGLQWTSGPNVKRIVFLVGDAPPHMDYEQERQYPDILKAAKQKGIIVNAVQAGDMPETTPIWKDIAQRGHGRFITIPQDGGEVVIIETPYDDDILHLQHELDLTVVPYGNLERRAEVESKMRDKAAAAPSASLDSSAYYSKRKAAKEVVTGQGDLIGDLRNNRVALDKLAQAELPDELKSKSAGERQTWIEDKISARRELEDKMAALIAKRDAFVLEQKNKLPKKSSNGFDSAVEETLKVQLN